MGESGVVSIKVMTNKFTGEPAGLYTAAQWDGVSDGPLCYSGYGFINFDSDQTAIIAMHRMGGKVTSVHLTWMSLTGTFIADHSQLHPASEVQAQPQFHSTGSRRGESCLARYVDVEILTGILSQIDTSIWVGDLTPEVDDLSLYRFFSARFQSIVSAKGNWTCLN